MSSRAAVRSSSTRAQALEQGRESFRKQAWGTAFSQLSAADREASLEPEDLVQLAQAAQLIGKEAEGADLLARAHQAFLSRGDEQLAARCAFWLGFTHCSTASSRRRAAGFRGRAGCSMVTPTAWKTDTCCCRRVTAHFIGRRRYGAYDVCEGHRDRGSLRRQGPDDAGASGPRPGLDPPGRNHPRRGAARRGHGCGDRWRGVSSERRRCLLQRARGLRRDLRSAACPAMDVGAREVVRVATGPGSLPWSLPRATR